MKSIRKLVPLVMFWGLLGAFGLLVQNKLHVGWFVSLVLLYALIWNTHPVWIFPE